MKGDALARACSAGGMEGNGLKMSVGKAAGKRPLRIDQMQKKTILKLQVHILRLRQPSLR
jgi:hypothetical protein